jgi:hypothetical protein
MQRNENGQPVFRFLGEAGKTYLLESSIDLRNWTPVTTLTTPDGTIIHTDLDAQEQTSRYYRVRVVE